MGTAGEIIPVILIKSQAEQRLTPKSITKFMPIILIARGCLVGEKTSEVEVGIV